MKIVVVGGTGLIGRRLVTALEEAGHEALPASPSTGVDSVTGEGLAAALDGADVVVDIPNSPSFDDQEVFDFFESSTTRLTAASLAAAVKHYVVLSIVGADRMPDVGYMRAKTAQENIVRSSGVAFTIVRATQFFEFIPLLAEGGADGDTVRLAPILMQPVAASDVAAELAAVVARDPANETWELSGPDRMRLPDLGRRVLAAAGDPRTVESAGTAEDGTMLPGLEPALTHRVGTTRFDEWLRLSF